MPVRTLPGMNPADTLQRAREHRAAGRGAEAEAGFRELLRAMPGQREATLELAALLADAGRIDEARRLLEDFVAARPSDADGHLQFAQFLRGISHDEEAAQQYESAAALLPRNAGVWNNLGNCYRDLLRTDDARRCLRQALALRPDFPEALNNLGSLCAELGEADRALDYYRRAIALRPDYFSAWRNLSLARRFEQPDAELRTMQTLYVRHSREPRAVMQLGFALGKACHDLGEHRKAFAYWAAANDAQRRLQPYSIADQLAEMRRLRECFDAGRVASAAGAGRAGLVPIFVVGMPRSGTSLVEQILASHSRVYGAGEREDVKRLTWDAVGGRYPEQVPGLSPRDWRGLGEAYLERIAAVSGGSAYVVDKLPENFKHLGHIRMMLRDAIVIHCRRDPMAVALSCYQNCFVASGLGYCCSLQDLGRYYRAYERMMRHWQRLLPGWILELRYEDLVAEPATRIRALLDHCGLPFEPGCLDFHRNRRQVGTASLLQVRRPIHQASVQRWRDYAWALGPFREALDDPPGEQRETVT